MKIAVIGSGISGLAAAYWLSRESDVQVTLMEGGGALGMDAHRSELVTTDRQRVHADVPSRMFNPTQWPSLVALYDEIGVAYEAVDASQSFSVVTDGQAASRNTFLRLDKALRPELGLRSIVAKKPRSILQEAQRLQHQGRTDLEQGVPAAMTFGDYLQRHKFSRPFVEQFLFSTLSSTVCTCSYESLRRYPAEILLSALRRLTDDRNLMRTSFGTRDVVSRLTQDGIDIRFNHRVSSLHDVGDGVELCINDSMLRFDQVVIATQANTALSMLPDLSARERSMLSSFGYEDIEVVIHTDSSLMPRRRADWSTFNMTVATESSDSEHASAMCSVWLNRFHREWTTSQNVFQTISPVQAPDPASVLAKIKLQRPVVDADSVAALATLDSWHQQPGRRIWFCGSWAAKGIPLLESGVVAARQAVAGALSQAAHLASP